MSHAGFREGGSEGREGGGGGGGKGGERWGGGEERTGEGGRWGGGGRRRTEERLARENGKKAVVRDGRVFVDSSAQDVPTWPPAEPHGRPVSSPSLSLPYLLPRGGMGVVLCEDDKGQ